MLDAPELPTPRVEVATVEEAGVGLATVSEAGVENARIPEAGVQLAGVRDAYIARAAGRQSMPAKLLPSDLKMRPEVVLAEAKMLAAKNVPAAGVVCGLAATRTFRLVVCTDRVALWEYEA